MWSRAELKGRAKNCLRKYYWAALAVTFLVGLLGGDGGGHANIGVLISRFAGTYRNLSHLNAGGTGIGRLIKTSGYHSFSQVNMNGLHLGRSIETAGCRNLSYAGGVGNPITGPGLLVIIFFTIFFIVAALGILYKILVGNVMTVGGCRFFMESRLVDRSAGVGKIFYGFGSGRYWNVVKTMFIMNLFIALWTLLLIIPGIIKFYEYYMVSYILSENPDMHYKEALAMSKEMMNGHKLDTFILDLSFIGWMILGIILLGIGIFFVIPYIQATTAELYAVLRSNIGPTGLRGFGAENEVYCQVVNES